MIISILLYQSFAVTGLLIVIGVGLVFLILISLVFGIANTVFNTALFVYGDTGAIPGEYSPDTMENAFRLKKERARI